MKPQIYVRREPSPGSRLGASDVCIARISALPGPVATCETFGGVFSKVPLDTFNRLWKPRQGEALPSRSVDIERHTPVHDTSHEGARYTYIHQGGLSPAKLRQALKKRGLRVGRMLDRYPCTNGRSRIYGLRFTVRGVLREIV